MDTSQLFFASLLLAASCLADAKALNCTEVSCPRGTQAIVGGDSAVPCPEDSHRPLFSHMHDGETVYGVDECCLALCKCRQPCPPPPSNCPEDAPVRVLKPATGSPGMCCPEYHCASPDDDHAIHPDEPPALALHSPRPILMEHPHYGCFSEKKGIIMADGQEWKEDPCTHCRCEIGEKKCQAYMCKASCDNPRHIPEECCPQCDSASVVTLPPHCPSLANCSLRCRQGLLKDKDGCFLCQCEAESTIPPNCPLLTTCKKNCTHGLRTNRNGCPVCKCNKCRQMVFSSSSPNTDGGSNGTILDSSTHGVMLLCSGPCMYGYKKDDRGCPSCWCNEPPIQPEDITSTYSEDITRAPLSCISSDGTERSPDDVWWDGCRKCHCLHGSESCTMISCPPTQHACDRPILIQGQCCPMCTDIFTESMKHWLWIFLAVLFVLLVLFALILRRYWFWPRRCSSPCYHENDQDEGDVVLGVSPSPSPTHSPVSTTQSNGTCKSLPRQYDIPQLSPREKGVRRSGDHYKIVPRYDTALVESEKTAFAPH